MNTARKALIAPSLLLASSVVAQAQISYDSGGATLWGQVASSGYSSGGFSLLNGSNGATDSFTGDVGQSSAYTNISATTFTSTLSSQTVAYTSSTSSAYASSIIYVSIQPGYYYFNEAWAGTADNASLTFGYTTHPDAALVWAPGHGYPSNPLIYGPDWNTSYSTATSGSIQWSGYLDAGIVGIDFGAFAATHGVGSANATSSTYFGLTPAPEPSSFIALSPALVLVLKRKRQQKKR